MLIGCALMPVANAKEAPAPKHTKSAEHSTPAAAEKTDKKKVSYGIGVDIGRNFKRLALDLDLDILTKGLKDAYTGKKLSIPDNELRNIMSAYQNELKEKQTAAIKNTGEANQKAGDAFLADNAKKDGVVTLPSGLQYKILKKGNGKTPGEADTVECNYRGTLIDGTEFDSSARIGKPVSIQSRRRYSRLAGSVEVDAGGFQMAALYPAATGLWSAGRRPRHRAKFHFGI